MVARNVDWFLKYVVPEARIAPELLSACHALEREGLIFWADFDLDDAQAILSNRIDDEYARVFVAS